MTDRTDNRKDIWIAEHLEKHRERIGVLEEQVTALNWVLWVTIQVLPAHVKQQWLRGELERETERLSRRMEESQESERVALDAGRKILLSAIKATDRVVLTTAQEEKP